MGLLDQDALNYGLITAGLSMLANNTSKRNPTQAIGMGGLAGLQGFAQAKQMAEAQRMKQLQELQMTMQLQALMKKSQKETEIETMVNQSNDPDLKQAYMLGGPEKAFEFMQTKKYMSGLDQFIPKPVQQQPPRQFMPDESMLPDVPIRGNFDLSTPGKIADIERDAAYLKQTNPAEYQNLVQALREQGLISAPQQQPNWSGMAEYGMRGALSGQKGATAVMEMAKLNKPDIQFLDTGAGFSPVDRNNPSSFVPKTLTPELQWNMQKYGEEKSLEKENKLNTSTTELRKEFASLPPVKDWHTVIPVLQTARESATLDNKAADLNLIYALAKLYDPGSVVRESETEMQMATGSPAERLKGYWAQVTGGGRLTPEVRAKMLEQVEIRAKAYHDSYQAAVGQYSDLSKRNGIDPANVILRTPEYKQVNTSKKIPKQLPSNPTASTLEVGQIYQTPKGLAEWDGMKFKKVMP